jgi:hypothetical protein
VLVELPAGRWAGTAGAEESGATVVLCRGPERRTEPYPALQGAPCHLAAGLT